LAEDYDEVLNAADFTATLLKLNDTTYSKTLFVMSVNDTDKSIKVKFPGADSGEYLIKLSSAQHGNIQSDLL
jgi:molybdopterin/thiamine biosynthesis adenylyltransferase